MKHIMLLTMFLLATGAVSGQNATETAATVSKIEIVMPGEFQPDQREIKSGEIWWGLCMTRGIGYELIETKVTVNTVYDSCVEADIPNLKTDVDKDFDFLVRGSSFFEEGHVKTEYACKHKILIPGDELQIRDFGKGCYSVFALGKVSEPRSVEDYSINIQRVGKQESSVQKLLELPKISFLSDEVPVIKWIGDLDRDGIPDILLDAHPYPGSLLVLFLSSEAKEGEIVHKVVEFQIWSC